MDFNFLNRLYNSENLNDIKKFYESIESSEKLVEFSRKRPRQKVKFFKNNFDNEKNVIAVIPTADGRKFNDFFEGRVPEILVESKGPYFNYSHSLNSGIKEALKYNPDWIITCNDDLFKIDRTEKMLNELKKNKDRDFLLAKPGYYNRAWYHTMPMQVITTNSLNYRFYKLSGLVDSNIREMLGVTEKLNVKKIIYSIFPTHESVLRMWWIFLNNFKPMSFYNMGDFSMIRSKTFKKIKFNELFINSHEDAFLSYQLKDFRGKIMDYRIGSFIGKTLVKKPSSGKIRKWRNVFFGAVVFDYLTNNGPEGI